jgi:hypothetical protein
MEVLKSNYYKVYREKNREKLDIYHANWIQENKEDYKKYQREYQRKYIKKYR